MVAELQHDALVFGVRVQRLVIVEARCVPLCGGDRAHAHTLPYTCPCALVLLRRLHNLPDAALSSLLRVPACLSLSLSLLPTPTPHVSATRLRSRVPCLPSSRRRLWLLPESRL